MSSYEFKPPGGVLLLFGALFLGLFAVFACYLTVHGELAWYCSAFLLGAESALIAYLFNGVMIHNFRRYRKRIVLSKDEISVPRSQAFWSDEVRIPIRDIMSVRPFKTSVNGIPVHTRVDIEFKSIDGRRVYSIPRSWLEAPAFDELIALLDALRVYSVQSSRRPHTVRPDEDISA